MSYSRDDSRFVLRLVDQLQLLGASLFVDQRDIGAGERWERVLEDEIRACEGLLVALSPSSVASEFVRREWTIALENDISIVPLLIADTTIPAELQGLERIDFTTRYAEAISKTLKALRLDVPKTVQRIYVSHDLDKEHLDLINVVARIVFSQGIQAVIEKRSVTAAKTEKQLADLTSCDGLLSILSRPAGIRSLKHIQDEFEHCDGTGKRNLVIAYADVDTASLVRGREFITYCQSEPMRFAISLSSVIAVWKHEAGKVIQARLELNKVPTYPLQSLQSPRLFYRTWTDGLASGWAETALILDTGGVTAFLRGVRDDQQIEVRLDDGQRTWESGILQQLLYIELQRI